MSEEEKKIFLKFIDEILNDELLFIMAALTEETKDAKLPITKEKKEKIEKEILEDFYPQGKEEEIANTAIIGLLKSTDLFLKLKDDGVDIKRLNINMKKGKLNNEESIPFESITYRGFKGKGFEEIMFSFNVSKILELFEKKRVNAVKNNSKLGNKYLLDEHINNLAIGTSKELKEHHKKIIDYRKKECISILQEITRFKVEELKIKTAIECFIYQPQTKEEYKKIRDIAKRNIKEIFGKNTEEYMSDLLINAWMHKKELELIK